MISDLTPGERMSLKGKLFELQKKLSIIDMERKMEKYPYQPQIMAYELPNRSKGFAQNNARAEIIRQQKKKLLQESIAQQDQESCTFSPKIFTSAEKFAHLDSRPVHVRLSEKAKEYRASKERRRVQHTLFDDSGRRLFSPDINRQPRPIGAGPESSTAIPQANTVAADEFLYQDAKDREIRHQNLILKYAEDARQEASTRKMNAISAKMLKRRTERSVATLFTMIDLQGRDTFTYRDLSDFLSRTQVWSHKSEEDSLRDVELVWNCFDHCHVGVVLRADFQMLGHCFLMHKSPTSAVESFQKRDVHYRAELLDQLQSSSSAGMDEAFAAVIGQRAQNESHLDSIKERDAQRFQRLLSSLVDFAVRESSTPATQVDQPGASSFRSTSRPQLPPSSVANTSAAVGGLGGSSVASGMTGRSSVRGTETSDAPAFQPHIYPHSYKLAQRKERREEKRLAQMMKQQQPQQQTGPGNDEVVLDEAEDELGDLAASLSLADLEGEASKRWTAKASQASASQQEMSRSSSNRPLLADKLVARSALAKEKQAQMAERLRLQESAEYTFRPRINEPTSRATQQKAIAEEALREHQRREQKLKRRAARDRLREQQLHNQQQLQLRESGGGGGASDSNGPDRMRRVMESLSDSAQQLVDPLDPYGAEDGQGVLVPQHNDDDDDIHDGDRSDGSSSSPPPPPPPQPPVHERLYALKDKHVHRKGVIPSTLPQYLLELEECTFTPKIEPAPAHLKHAPVNPINDYDKTVQRMRDVQAQKQKRKEDEENAWKAVDERYHRSRALLQKEGTRPFNFQSEERLAQQAAKRKQQRHQSQEKAEIVVEVKLSSAKTARIRVAPEEDPSDAVQSFAKIYGLEQDAVQVLCATVQQAQRARQDAIARAQAEAEEAERRLREAADEAEAEEQALQHQHQQQLMDGADGDGEFRPEDHPGLSNGRYHRRSKHGARDAGFNGNNNATGNQQGRAGNTNGGLRTISDELEFVAVDDDYSSYTDSNTEDDEEYDDDDEDDGDDDEDDDDGDDDDEDDVDDEDVENSREVDDDDEEGDQSNRRQSPRRNGNGNVT